MGSAWSLTFSLTIQCSGPDKLRATDQGQRFKFPNGIPGKIQCQAHSDDVVGYDSKSNSFRADLSANSADAAIAENSTSSNYSQIQIYLHDGQHYLSGAADGRSPSVSKFFIREFMKTFRFF